MNAFARIGTERLHYASGEPVKIRAKEAFTGIVLYSGRATLSVGSHLMSSAR